MNETSDTLEYILDIHVVIILSITDKKSKEVFDLTSSKYLVKILITVNLYPINLPCVMNDTSLGRRRDTSYILKDIHILSIFCF